jgi:hypothetical protein
MSAPIWQTTLFLPRNLVSPFVMYYLSLFLLSFNLYFKKSPSNNRKPPKFRFPTDAAIHFANGEQVNPHGRVSFRKLAPTFRFATFQSLERIRTDKRRKPWQTNKKRWLPFCSFWPDMDKKKGENEPRQLNCYPSKRWANCCCCCCVFPEREKRTEFIFSICHGGMLALI